MSPKKQRKMGRERKFSKDKSSDRENSVVEAFNQWRYKKKDKIFEMQYNHPVNRFSEPQKFPEDQFSMTEVG